ncbi:MAG: hypothetical protein Q4F05_10440 [bacterium]|nr:hypothetical protein [bacterium]
MKKSNNLIIFLCALIFLVAGGGLIWSRGDAARYQFSSDKIEMGRINLYTGEAEKVVEITDQAEIKKIQDMFDGFEMKKTKEDLMTQSTIYIKFNEQCVISIKGCVGQYTYGGISDKTELNPSMYCLPHGLASYVKQAVSE